MVNSGAVNSEVAPIGTTTTETPVVEEGTNPSKSTMEAVNKNDSPVKEGDDEKFDDVTLKDTPSDEDDDGSPSGSGSDTEEHSKDQTQAAETKRKKSLFGYFAVYGTLFVLVATIIIVPSVISTQRNLVETQTPAPAPTAGSPGGLSLPASQQEIASESAWINPDIPNPAPAPAAPLTWQTRAPSIPPSSSNPAKPGPGTGTAAAEVTPRPTQRATAEVTPKPTQRASNPTSKMPTAMPTPAPATLLPTPLPSVPPFNDEVYNTPLFNYLVVLGTPRSTLMDPATPQGKAFLWLMNPQVEQISVFRVAERYALVALDFALHQSPHDTTIQVNRDNDDDPSRRWRTYDSDYCEWDGVTCNMRKEVVGINWARQSLTGKIIHEIGLLSQLETLDLAQNQIRGNLDPFWQLSHLKQMYLFENRFSGVVPVSPAPAKLERVFLGHNNLEGPFPVAFATIAGGGPNDLRYLILHHNNFNGTLPERLRLRQIYYLDLSSNQFEGSIGHIDWPQLLPAVRIMYLNDNKFSGELPEDFPMTGGGNIKQLFIDGNQFTGVFPSKGWSDYHMTNMNIARNDFEKIDKNLCKIGVFEGGEMVELKADCNVCECETLCHTCSEEPEEEPVLMEEGERRNVSWTLEGAQTSEKPDEEQPED